VSIMNTSTLRADIGSVMPWRPFGVTPSRARRQLRTTCSTTAAASSRSSTLRGRARRAKARSGEADSPLSRNAPHPRSTWAQRSIPEGIRHSNLPPGRERSRTLPANGILADGAIGSPGAVRTFGRSTSRATRSARCVRHGRRRLHRDTLFLADAVGFRGNAR